MVGGEATSVANVCKEIITNLRVIYDNYHYAEMQEPAITIKALGNVLISSSTDFRAPSPLTGLHLLDILTSPAPLIIVNIIFHLF
jgi:hypothetical protein